jgi:hypothetical protein
LDSSPDFRTLLCSSRACHAIAWATAGHSSSFFSAFSVSDFIAIVVPDNATEEFKRISEFMRTYLLLRLYRLTLLLGTSGAVVTALASDNIRRRGEVVILLLKLGALAISTAFTVMDFSAGGHWIRLRDRANELAAGLGYQRFPSPSRWNPFTANGAGNYLHVFVVLLWSLSLFLNPGS